MQLKAGQHVWVQVPNQQNELYTQAKVESITSDEIVCATKHGSMSFRPDNVFPMNPPELDRVDDNVQLMHLDEPNIIHNLQARYHADQIYTYTAHILVSCNPYKRVSGLYNPEVMHSYRNKYIGQMPPHVYAIADRAFRSMKADQVSQSVIVSGESGAGKTEASKDLMRFLLSQSPNGEREGDFEEKILRTNPILEAFGNAKTLRNDNSSRFGKFIQIHFVREENGCHVQGASIRTYLLEKARLVSQVAGERNYHVFYYLANNTGYTNRGAWWLNGSPSFRYLCPVSGQPSPVDDATDTKMFQELLSAMEKIGMSTAEIDNVFQTVAATLWLGNVDFVAETEEMSAVADITPLARAAKLLSVESKALAKTLTKRDVNVRGETFEKPLTEKEAQYMRDNIAKSIYSRLFEWLVHRINTTLRAEGDVSPMFIGVLDIYGFEFFESNGFEQLCINYANEKLQQLFVHNVLKYEQELYRREGIPWTDIQYADNTACIELLEQKPTGVFAMLNEECRLPKGSAASFLEKLHEVHRGSKHIKEPRTLRAYTHVTRHEGFVVSHFAAEVCYQAEWFLDKNNDSLRPEIKNLFTTSSFSFLNELGNQVSVEPAVPSDRRTSLTPTKRAGGGQKFSSVSRQFERQLNELMTTLHNTAPNYIRCIKPNDAQRPGLFDPHKVTNQLRASGTLELVNLMHCGFPTRVSYDDLYARYGQIMPRSVRNLKPTDFAEAILMALEMQPEDFRLGLTRVFFTSGKLAFLEELRDKELPPHLAAAVVRWLVRKRFRRALSFVNTVRKLGLVLSRQRLVSRFRRAVRVCCIIKQTMFRAAARAKRTSAAVAVQAAIRMYLCRRRLSQLRRAALTTSRHFRGSRARKVFAVLRKKALDEKVRQQALEALRRQEEASRAAAEAAQAQKRQKRMLEEAEEKRKQAEEELEALREETTQREVKRQRVMEENLEKTKKEMMEVQEEADCLAKNLEMAKSSLCEVEKRATVAEARAQELADEVDRYKSELDSAVARASCACAELEASKKTSYELSQKVTHLASTLEATQGQHSAEMQATCQKHREEITALSAQLQDVNISKETMQSEMQKEVARYTHELESLQSRGEETVAALSKQLEETKESAATQVAALQKELDASREKSEEIQTSLKEEMSSMREKYEETIASLRTDATENTNKLEQTIKKLEETISGLNAEATVTEGKHKEELTALREELESARVQSSGAIMSLTDELDQTRAEIETLNGNLEAAETKIAQLEASAKTVQEDSSATIDALRKELSDAEHQMASRESSFEVSEAELKKSHAEEVVGLTQKLAALKQAHEEELSSVRAITGKEKEEAEAALTARVKALEAELCDVRSNLEATKQEAEDAKREVEFSKETNKTLAETSERDLAAALKEGEKARAESTAAYARAEEAESQTSALRSERERAVRELAAALHADSDDVTSATSSEDLIAMALKLANEHRQLVDDLDASRKRAAAAAKDLKKAEADNASLREEVHQSKMALNRAVEDKKSAAEAAELAEAAAQAAYKEKLSKEREQYEMELATVRAAVHKKVNKAKAASAVSSAASSTSSTPSRTRVLDRDSVVADVDRRTSDEKEREKFEAALKNLLTPGRTPRNRRRTQTDSPAFMTPTRDFTEGVTPVKMQSIATATETDTDHTEPELEVKATSSESDEPRTTKRQLTDELCAAAEEDGISRSSKRPSLEKLSRPGSTRSSFSEMSEEGQKLANLEKMVEEAKRRRMSLGGGEGRLSLGGRRNSLAPSTARRPFGDENQDVAPSKIPRHRSMSNPHSRRLPRMAQKVSLSPVPQSPARSQSARTPGASPAKSPATPTTKGLRTRN